MTDTKLDLEHLRARLSTQKEKSEQVTSQDPEKTIASITETEARGRNAFWLVGVYALMLCGAWYIFYRHGQAGSWEIASNNMIELIKIGVMPIMTLVIGYYFGRNEKK
ncbi:hypothetical protein [Terasakiella pusilla]|uniref:hypothetical protein n=1 Tax=Terasakiella pusilla TaxID=64973 RepID=UPI003AA8D5FD